MDLNDLEKKHGSSKFKSGKNFLSGFIIVFTIAVTSAFILWGVSLFNEENNGKLPDDITDVSDKSSLPNPLPPLDGIRIEKVTEKDWVRGNRNAKISVIEFSDTECQFCKRFHPTMMRVVKEYKGEVNWVYRHFPLVGPHPKAPKEAEAVECAGELAGNDGFWAYLDRIFEITPSNNGLDLNLLPEIAEYVGLNREDFVRCLESGKYAEKVEDQVRQAVAAGGNGTPYSVILTRDGKTIPISGALPFAQIKATIDPLLKK